ncbi:MAG TPA: serine hydrolase domain-containing protein [Verrucomicrobiae bacterium]|nr:serine hydrolase domain-containing protein [Verrucomicrobiae bacterium]
MTKFMLLGIALVLFGGIIFVRAANSKMPATVYDDPISQRLETIRVKHNVPAIAVAVVLDGKIVATNAVGFRRKGGPERVTVADKFHLGSITKSMTATLAARLVEEGKISWTNTVGEVFSDFKNEIDPDYRGVTLEQLLAQRGGAPGNAPKNLWANAWKATGTPTEQRLEFVKGLLTLKPEAKPGSKYIYSNQGYAVAGAMLEKKTGIAWEDLMRKYLFEPLQMNSAGFGAPATIGKVDQPWGHISSSGLIPVPPDDPHADNPAAIGPAGTVHCSIEDLAKYAAFHLAGDRGDGKLLKPESFKKLHTAIPDNNNYALGWVVLKRKWAGGRVLWHNGSNTMFYAVVWIAPNRNFAVVAASNAGGSDAEKACDDAATEMIRKFLPE